jgi:hypothetical protein
MTQKVTRDFIRNRFSPGKTAVSSWLNQSKCNASTETIEAASFEQTAGQQLKLAAIASG